MSDATDPIKAIFIDAETAFDMYRLNEDETADRWGVAKAAKAVNHLRGDKIKLYVVVQGSGKTEEENVREFYEKEKRLTQYFFDDKEIVSQIPLEKSAANVFANILTRAEIAAEDALYITAAGKTDPRVAQAGIDIVDASSQENIWRRLKRFAFGQE